MNEAEKVRQQDIVDLKEAITVLHQRIDRNSDQNREDFQRLYDKTDALNEGIQGAVIEIQKMVVQITLNDQALVQSSKDLSEHEKAVEDKIGPIVAEIRTWKNRFWYAVGFIFLKMAAIIWYLLTNGSAEAVIEAVNEVSK